MADEREEIARLIDPWNFWDAENAVEWCRVNRPERGGWDLFCFVARSLGHVQEAYAKADAILARAQGPAIDSEDVANLRDALVNMAGLLREMDRVAPAPGSNHEPVANIMERAASAIGRLMAERRINAIARAQGPGEAVAWRYRFRSQWALSGWSYVDGPERPDLNEWDGFSGYEVEPLYAATPTREG